jgi:hypothetical protein
LSITVIRAKLIIARCTRTPFSPKIDMLLSPLSRKKRLLRHRQLERVRGGRAFQRNPCHKEWAGDGEAVETTLTYGRAVAKCVALYMLRLPYIRSSFSGKDIAADVRRKI